MDRDEYEQPVREQCADLESLESVIEEAAAWNAAHVGSAEARGVEPCAVLALIERLRAAEARASWQPMDTAPTGRMVLTSTRHEIVHVHGTRVWHHASLGTFDGHQWYDEHGSPMHTPSAWTPLPEPPRD